MTTTDPESTEPDQAPDPTEPDQGEPAVRYGRRRRAPRYGSFIASGAIAGIALGMLLAAVQAIRDHDPSQFSANTVLGYVAATLGLVGALLGAAVAVILDRRRS